MNKTRIGIIGCGNISPIYAQAGGKFENIEVVACADMDRARAVALAEKYNIPHAMHVDDILKDDGVDLIINLTVPNAHAEVAFQILKNGKHVYNEKPLALRRKEAREFIGLAREKKLRVGCAPDTFLGGGMQTCRKMIDDGVIGEPVGASAFMLSRGPDHWHPNPDFFYKKGAGPLFDMGPYYLTAFVSLLGPVKRVTGSSRISFARRQVKDRADIEVETPTHINGVLDFESGVVGTIATSFDVSAHNLPHIEIYGSEGTISVPDPNTFGGPVMLKKRGDQNWTEIPLEFGYSENSRGLGVADMAAAIQTGREHRANERMAFHVLDIMHSIYDASDTGRHIELKSTATRPYPLPQGLAPGQIEI